MRNLDKERLYWGLLCSLLLHSLVFLALSFTGALREKPSQTNITEIAVIGGGGGGGAADGIGLGAGSGHAVAKEGGDGMPEEAEINTEVGVEIGNSAANVRKHSSSGGAAAGTQGRGKGGGTGTGRGIGAGNGSGGCGAGAGSSVGDDGETQKVYTSPAEPPRVTGTVPPVYPPALRDAGVEGVVVVRVIVGINGRAETAEVAKSSGNSVLDASAAEAVRKWSFRPARNNIGAKVRCYMSIPVRFKIQYS